MVFFLYGAKTTLIRGNVGRAVADYPTCKMGNFFIRFSDSNWAKFPKFANKWSFGTNSQTKISFLLCVKCTSFRGSVFTFRLWLLCSLYYSQKYYILMFPSNLIWRKIMARKIAKHECICMHCTVAISLYQPLHIYDIYKPVTKHVMKCWWSLPDTVGTSKPIKNRYNHFRSEKKNK